MNTFKLEILLPDKQLFEGEVYSLSVPAADGRLGVLAHHAPLLTLLRKGEIRVETKGGENPRWQIGSGLPTIVGFLRVENNRAQVLLG